MPLGIAFNQASNENFLISKLIKDGTYSIGLCNSSINEDQIRKMSPTLIGLIYGSPIGCFLICMLFRIDAHKAPPHHLLQRCTIILAFYRTDFEAAVVSFFWFAVFEYNHTAGSIGSLNI